jgi:hypothetical protein
MITGGCDSCIDQARERMKDFDSIKQKAKQHAKQNKMAVAICKEGDTGNYFLANPADAFRNQCAVVEIVSDL